MLVRRITEGTFSEVLLDAMESWLGRIDWALVGPFGAVIMGAVVGGIVTYALTGHLERGTAARLVRG